MPSKVISLCSFNQERQNLDNWVRKILGTSTGRSTYDFLWDSIGWNSVISLHWLHGRGEGWEMWKKEEMFWWIPNQSLPQKWSDSFLFYSEDLIEHNIMWCQVYMFTYLSININSTRNLLGGIASFGYEFSRQRVRNNLSLLPLPLMIV